MRPLLIGDKPPLVPKNSCRTVRIGRRRRARRVIRDGSSQALAARSPADILALDPQAPDGAYWINWGDGGPALRLWCDMATVFPHPNDGPVQGFATCLTWDRDWPGGTHSLALDAGRVSLNSDNLAQPFAPGVGQSGSLDMRRPLLGGATLLGHCAWLNGTTPKYHYVSEIYQVVRDNPNNVFNRLLDYNNKENDPNARLVGFSATLRNRWFFTNGTLCATDTDGHRYNQTLAGGAGDAMFSNTSREGAVYCSTIVNAGGHDRPRVQWGFFGRDQTQQTYGAGGIHVGTACHPSFGSMASYNTVCRYNAMLIYLPPAVTP